jgi:DNA polymerase III delta prime subunit
MNIREIFTPKSIDDFYNQNLIDFVKSGEKEQIRHFLFWGNPGTGKTEFAHLLAKYILGEVDVVNFTEFNSSDDRGIDFIKTQVKDIAMSASFDSMPKVIYLSEADGLTHEAQAALRRIMEIGNAIFILSANYPAKIIPALKNRCSVWEFK